MTSTNGGYESCEASAGPRPPHGIAPCYRGRAIIRVAPNTLWNVDPSRRCCLSNVPSTWTWSPLRRVVDTGKYTNTLPQPAELLSKKVMYLLPPCEVPLLIPAATPSRI